MLSLAFDSAKLRMIINLANSLQGLQRKKKTKKAETDSTKTLAETGTRNRKRMAQQKKMLSHA